MSRQNKNIKNRARAAQYKGNTGPARTEPKHGKDPSRRIYTTKCRSYSEFQERNKKGSKKPVHV
jgi:hypothetical protein